MKTVAIFPYFPELDPDFGEVFDPRIFVVFVNGTFELELDPLLDSGSDMTILPHRFGLYLGLTPEDDTPIELVGEGMQRVYLCEEWAEPRGSRIRR